MNKLSLGCDPEIFLKDAANSFRSVIGLIGGSKYDPKPLVELGDGFCVQEDNVALEYNIPPSTSKEAWDQNINKIMDFLQKEVSNIGLHFARESAVSFPETELWHPAAQEFGCDPDYNAWRNGAMNPRPKAQDQTLRTCGGHVHVGYDFKDKEETINFVKMLDVTLSIPAVLMDDGVLRKKLYGNPGAFRWKPFGIEYRSLSNFWIFDSKYRNWLWDSVNLALDYLHTNRIDLDAEKSQILNCINDNNKEQAIHFVEKYNLYLV